MKMTIAAVAAVAALGFTACSESKPAETTVETHTTETTTTAPAEAAEVRKDHEAPHFHLFVDALQVFTSPNNVKIADKPYSHGDAFSATLSANYADMFVIDHIHNH